MTDEYWNLDHRPRAGFGNVLGDPATMHGIKVEPLYRVIWGRGPTSTLPMLWSGVLRFVRIVRKSRGRYPIRVERVR